MADGQPLRHLEELSDSMYQLQQDDLLCDLNIHVNERVYKLHTVVLAAVSRKLRENLLLTQSSDTSKVPAFDHFSLLDHQTITQLLRYLYTGQLNLGHCDVTNLKICCHELDIESVVRLCDKYEHKMRVGQAYITQTVNTTKDTAGFNTVTQSQTKQNCAEQNPVPRAIEEVQSNRYLDRESIVLQKPVESISTEEIGLSENKTIFSKCSKFDIPEKPDTHIRLSGVNDFGDSVSYRSVDRINLTHRPFNIEHENFAHFPRNIDCENLRDCPNNGSCKPEIDRIDYVVTAEHTDVNVNSDIKHSKDNTDIQKPQGKGCGVDSKYTNCCDTDKSTTTEANEISLAHTNPGDRLRDVSLGSRHDGVLEVDVNEIQDIWKERLSHPALTGSCVGSDSITGMLTCCDPPGHDQSNENISNSKSVSVVLMETESGEDIEEISKVGSQFPGRSLERETSAPHLTQSQSVVVSQQSASGGILQGKNDLRVSRDSHTTFTHVRKKIKSDFTSSAAEDSGVCVKTQEREMSPIECPDVTANERFLQSKCVKLEVIESTSSERLGNLKCETDSEVELNFAMAESSSGVRNPLSQASYRLDNPVTKETGQDGYCCVKCDERFPSKKELTLHKKTSHKAVNPRKYKCESCEYKARTEKLLLIHRQDKHDVCLLTQDKYPVYSCQVTGCNYTTLYANTLERHCNSTHAEKRFVCEYCGESMKSQVALQLHVLIHQDIKPHTCEYCGRSFRQSSTCKTHVRVVHEGQAAVKKFHCEECKLSFKVPSVLAFHRFLKHGVPLPDGVTRYVCEKCDWCTQKRTIYEVHMRRHKGERPFKCKTCNKAFPSSSEVKTHQRCHGEKKFKCTFDDCSYASVAKEKLTQHVRLMHTHRDEKPYACHLCPHRSAVKGNLNTHLRLVHQVAAPTREYGPRVFSLNTQVVSPISNAIQRTKPEQNSPLHPPVVLSDSVSLKGETAFSDGYHHILNSNDPQQPSNNQTILVFPEDVSGNNAISYTNQEHIFSSFTTNQDMNKTTDESYRHQIQETSSISQKATGSTSES